MCKCCRKAETVVREMWTGLSRKYVQLADAALTAGRLEDASHFVELAKWARKRHDTCHMAC